MVAEKERARMLELGRDSRENLRKATEERNQRCLDRALAPPVAKTGRRPMFRSHLRKTNKQRSFLYFLIVRQFQPPEKRPTFSSDLYADVYLG